MAAMAAIAATSGLLVLGPLALVALCCGLPLLLLLFMGKRGGPPDQH